MTYNTQLGAHKLKTYRINNIGLSLHSILLFFISFYSFGQGPGSLFIDAGPDIEIACGTSGCADLTANFLETFETNSGTYTVNAIDYAPPFAFNGLANSLNPDIDDAWSPVDNLPFDFCFFGNLEQEFQVGSNGVIRFDVDPDDTGPGSNAYSFSQNLPNNTEQALSEANIFTPVHDIDPSASNSEEIGYEILGVFPNRVLIVSYFEVPLFSGSCNTLLATHMVVFYEFSNVIEMYIQDKPACPTWQNGAAAIGIQNDAGTTAYVPPGRNTSDSPWTTNNEAWRFSPDGVETYLFEWLDASGTVIGTTPTINVCPPGGSGTYTARITYTNNCNGDTVVLTDDVVVTSLVNFSVDLGGDQQLCDETFYDITASVSGTTGSATYLWSTGDITETITVTQSGIYSVDVTIDDCTINESVMIGLEENFIIELGPDIETCFGQSIVLDASPSNYDPALATYEWSVDGNIIIGEIQATYVATQTGNYSVLVTGNVCSGSDSVEISSSSLDLSLGSDITTCFEEPLILDASPSNYDPALATYQWSFNGSLISGAIDAILMPNEHGTYSVAVTLANCSEEDTIVIEPNELSVSLGNNFETCFENTVVLEAAVSNYNAALATYAWSFNGSPITNETLPNLEISQTGIYRVLVTGGGCNGSAMVVISPRSDLEVELGDGFKSCTDEPQTITATSSETGLSYAWFLNGSLIAGESSPDLNFEIETGAIGTQTYSVTITKGDCTGTDSLDISLYNVGNCVVSQGISPNGDGMNDCLDLEYLVDRNGSFSIEVFNRFGTSIYSNSNYLNQWCGQTNNGSDLPTAAYFYVIKYATPMANSEPSKTGWIYLNRASN